MPTSGGARPHRRHLGRVGRARSLVSSSRWRLLLLVLAGLMVSWVLR